MSERGKKDDYKISITVTTTTKIMVAIGLCIIILSNFNYGTTEGNGAFVIGKSIFGVIGSTLLSAGLVSIVVEISTISQIVRKAVKDLLEESFPFEKLSKKRLDDINKQLAVLRCDDRMDIQDIERSVYAFEPELLDLSKGLYYEYHRAEFVISPDEESGTFKKKVDLNYKIINKFHSECYAQVSINLICKDDKLTKEKVRSMFKILSFTLEESEKIKTTGRRANETNLTADVEKYIEISDVPYEDPFAYKYTIRFKYPLQGKLASVVKLVYEYSIPQSDIMQSYKLNYPSKCLDHIISIQSEDWKIMGDAFTAFYFPSLYDKEYKVIQGIPNTIRVDFRDWAMPGAGYLVTFLKK